MNPAARLSAKLHRRVCLVLTEDAVLAEELLARRPGEARQIPLLLLDEGPHEDADGPHLRQVRPEPRLGVAPVVPGLELPVEPVDPVEPVASVSITKVVEVVDDEPLFVFTPVDSTSWVSWTSSSSPEPRAVTLPLLSTATM